MADQSTPTNTAYVAHRTRPEPLLKRMRRETVAYAFIGPSLALVIVFMIVPLIHSVWMSFHDWNGITQAQFIGTENYRDLLSDRRFAGALKNTRCIWCCSRRRPSCLALPCLRNFAAHGGLAGLPLCLFRAILCSSPP